MATKEEIDEQALKETFAKIGEDMIRDYSPQGIFCRAFLAGRESMEKEHSDLILEREKQLERILGSTPLAQTEAHFQTMDYLNETRRYKTLFRQAIGESK